jgi:multiple sugar transport system substrate-binding protein
MNKLGRRVVLRGSVGLAAAGTFASPYIARAQAKTASVLWVQGFVKEEDEAFQNLVAAYEKASSSRSGRPCRRSSPG